jgi:hypothetical protein
MQAYLARVQLWSDGFYATPKLHWNRDTLTGPAVLLLCLWRGGQRGGRGHAHRRVALLRADVLHDAGRSLEPGGRHRAGRGRFHPGHGLAHDGGTGVAPGDRPLDDARAEHLQDPHGQRHASGLQRGALRWTRTGKTASTAARRWASRRCCCRSPCSTPSAMRCRPWATPRGPAAARARDARGHTGRHQCGAAGFVCAPMNDAALRTLAEAWLADGTPAWIVRVGRTQGSVPRHTGTRMLVRADGAPQAFGTVGGGHLEWKAIDHASRLLRGEPLPTLLNFPLGPALGQCCGGTVALAFEPLTVETLAAWPSSPPWFHLQLYGAGHVGRAIARAVEPLQVTVDWIDERDDAFPTLPSPTHIRRVAVDAVEAEVATAPPGSCILVTDTQPRPRPAHHRGRAAPGRLPFSGFDRVGHQTCAVRASFPGPRHRTRLAGAPGLPDWPTRHSRQRARGDRRRCRGAAVAA